MANKILVLPDIHGRKFWRSALEKYLDEVDVVVALGDYHDPYYDYEGITYKESLNNMREFFDFANDHTDKIIRLLGNHDLHYISDYFGDASRYDKVNGKAVKELLHSNLKHMRLTYMDEIGDKKYLFSHAGLCKSWVEQYKEVIGELTVENLNKLPYSREGINALAQCSKYRMFFGGSDSGSIVWSDVRERVHKPSENYDEFFQVFGQTQASEPILMDNWAMLDCSAAFLIDNEGIKQITEDGTKILEKTKI